MIKESEIVSSKSIFCLQSTQSMFEIFNKHSVIGVLVYRFVLIIEKTIKSVHHFKNMEYTYLRFNTIIIYKYSVYQFMYIF